MNELKNQFEIKGDEGGDKEGWGDKEDKEIEGDKDDKGGDKDGEDVKIKKKKMKI